VVTTICNSHCGGTCVLKVHVKGGAITRIETDDGEEPQLRACLKGRAYRQRIYAPDRLKYPMKRVGARGEGKFERISWDEALDTVAGEIQRVNKTYGSSAILYWVSAGDGGALHGVWRRMSRLFCLMGGYTRPWGLHSYEGAIFAELTTYGNALVTDTRDNLLSSRLIILWGWDPVNTIADTNTTWYLIQAKEAGIRIISIDPRYTDTTATLAHEWIPIRPGTDAAMLIAMANVIMAENLQDQAFLDSYTVGFEAFKNYVLGVEDGIPKTPGWAEAITGVPAGTIYRLAKEYATTKPAALMAGIAPGRTAYGEQYHRAAITLAAMTGNIGIPGGSAAGKVWSIMNLLGMGSGLRIPPNAVDAETPPPKDKLPSRGSGYVYGHGAVNVFRLTDAILKGKSGGYPADYKLFYLSSSNIVNQWPNSNRVAEALKKLDFVVVEEQFMTATAKFADIVLPTCTFLERNEVLSGVLPPFYGYRNKIIETLYESNPIPKYIETWESANDPLASKYPLQLITTHCKRRAHTQFDNIPWLRELEPHAVKMNTIDAQARGIQDGDLVRVFNDRGRMIIPARVTERIMPGVVDLPQGAWYSPDENGVDRGGCANTLTRDEPSPGGALPSNTALVQVKKHGG